MNSTPQIRMAESKVAMAYSTGGARNGLYLRPDAAWTIGRCAKRHAITNAGPASRRGSASYVPSVGSMSSQSFSASIP